MAGNIKAKNRVGPKFLQNPSGNLLIPDDMSIPEQVDPVSLEQRNAILAARRRTTWFKEEMVAKTQVQSPDLSQVRVCYLSMACRLLQSTQIPSRVKFILLSFVSNSNDPFRFLRTFCIVQTKLQRNI